MQHAAGNMRTTYTETTCNVHHATCGQHTRRQHAARSWLAANALLLGTTGSRGRAIATRLRGLCAALRCTARSIAFVAFGFFRWMCLPCLHVSALPCQGMGHTGAADGRLASLATTAPQRPKSDRKWESEAGLIVSGNTNCDGWVHQQHGLPPLDLRRSIADQWRRPRRFSI